MEKEKIISDINELREVMSEMVSVLQEIDTNLSYAQEFISRNLPGWKDVTLFCSSKAKAFNQKLIPFGKNVEKLAKNLKEIESELSNDSCLRGELIDIQIEDMPGLSKKKKNACKKAGICYMVEFITRFKTRKDILRIRNIGVNSVNEIEEALAKYKVELK